MMTPNAPDPAVIKTLADDALEASCEGHAAATLMLVEAAASIIVTYHDRPAATELAKMFADYFLSTINGAFDFREGKRQ